MPKAIQRNCARYGVTQGAEIVDQAAEQRGKKDQYDREI
jgi:hypothetical protein